jgi:hypothetical protein
MGLVEQRLASLSGILCDASRMATGCVQSRGRRQTRRRAIGNVARTCTSRKEASIASIRGGLTVTPVGMVCEPEPIRALAIYCRALVAASSSSILNDPVHHGTAHGDRSGSAHVYLAAAAGQAYDSLPGEGSAPCNSGWVKMLTAESDPQGMLVVQ